jgi:oligopeptide transport system ATP-binding protein
MTFLNPVLKIETQLVEPILNHTNMSKKEANAPKVENVKVSPFSNDTTF